MAAMPITKKAAYAGEDVPVTLFDLVCRKLDERVVANVPAGRPIELALTKRELDDPDLLGQIKATYEDEKCGWTCELVLNCLVLT